MSLDPVLVHRVLSATPPDACQVGWFAARQPGVVHYLERRCGGATDAFAVALEAAWRICVVFENRDGVPPARVPRGLLSRAEAAVGAEAAWGATRGEGCAARQPDLCAYVTELSRSPPLPLAADEQQMVATALAALVYALDEVTTGRQVP